MAAVMVPIKTPEGQAELVARQRSVSQRHRTVLFLVDGRRSAEDVRSMALQAGVPEGCFDDLMQIGLIMMVEPTFSLLIETPADDNIAMHVDLPLPGPDSVGAVADSLLPASRSLYPETVTGDSTLGHTRTPESWFHSEPGAHAGADMAFAEARLILARAVRAEAPLAGSLTLLRLRRARTRADLIGLLDEVEARISKPHRSLAATHTMRRVRQLLDGRVDSSLAPV
jgi:hypothetical protein